MGHRSQGGGAHCVAKRHYRGQLNAAALSYGASLLLEGESTMVWVRDFIL